jgi:hypothetical protein
VRGLPQVDFRETPLDMKCGLVHSISHSQTTDSLYDVKIALTSFDGRKTSGNSEGEDDALSDDFVERVYFRLWTNAASSARPSA